MMPGGGRAPMGGAYDGGLFGGDGGGGGGGVFGSGVAMNGLFGRGDVPLTAPQTPSERAEHPDKKSHAKKKKNSDGDSADIEKKLAGNGKDGDGDGHEDEKKSSGFYRTASFGVGDQYGDDSVNGVDDEMDLGSLSMDVAQDEEGKNNTDDRLVRYGSSLAVATYKGKIQYRMKDLGFPLLHGNQALRDVYAPKFIEVIVYIQENYPQSPTQHVAWTSTELRRMLTICGVRKDLILALQSEVYMCTRIHVYMSAPGSIHLCTFTHYCVLWGTLQGLLPSEGSHDEAAEATLVSMGTSDILAAMEGTAVVRVIGRRMYVNMALHSPLGMLRCRAG